MLSGAPIRAYAHGMGNNSYSHSARLPTRPVTRGGERQDEKADEVRHLPGSGAITALRASASSVRPDCSDTIGGPGSARRLRLATSSPSGVSTMARSFAPTVIPSHFRRLFLN
jgi:hypothetical protein